MAEGENNVPGDQIPGDKAPDSKAPDNNEGGGGKPPEPTMAEILAQLKAANDKLAAFDKAQADAATAAEADRVAKLSEAEKLAEERKAFLAEKESLETAKKGLANERREAALDKLRVNAKYRSFAPNVDPSTADGAKALETWAAQNPELLVKAAGAPNVEVPAGAIADILSGKRKSSLVSVEGLKKTFGIG